MQADQDKKEQLAKWHELKYHLHAERESVPLIKERDIWWCVLGENIGVEMNGKGDQFLRPVIVLKKLNQNFMLVIPLTSKTKTGSWFVSFVFAKRQQTAVLSQIRVVSAKRMLRRMGTLSPNDFAAIKKAFRQLYY